MVFPECFRIMNPKRVIGTLIEPSVRVAIIHTATLADAGDTKSLDIILICVIMRCRHGCMGFISNIIVRVR